jgi:hypothetical protein
MAINLGRLIGNYYTNKSGATVNYGDFVIVDSATAQAFKTTNIEGDVSGEPGVVMEPNGIANNGRGFIATGGDVPQLNLDTASALLDYVRSSTTVGKGKPHSSPKVAGDFAQVLGTGTTPPARLFGGVVPGIVYAPLGLPGATQASRYVGATASGAPVSGTFSIGDFVIAQNGAIWICTVAGSPGTWASFSGGKGITGVTKVRKTAVQNIATGAWRTITWDVEDYDNLGAFDSGVSNVNITVPTGITLAKVSLFVSWANNSASGRYINLKNNANEKSLLFDIRNALNETGTALSAGWIPVTAGDVYSLKVNSGSQTLNFGDATFPATYPQMTIEWLDSFANLHL